MPQPMQNNNHIYNMNKKALDVYPHKHIVNSHQTKNYMATIITDHCVSLFSKPLALVGDFKAKSILLLITHSLLIRKDNATSPPSME